MIRLVDFLLLLLSRRRCHSTRPNCHRSSTNNLVVRVWQRLRRWNECKISDAGSHRSRRRCQRGPLLLLRIFFIDRHETGLAAVQHEAVLTAILGDGTPRLRRC